MITLMSMNYQQAKQDVQRVIDDATGDFRADFAAHADDFTKVVETSKVVTTAAVNVSAVQSMTPNSAVVLVAATSEVTNAGGADKAPRTWRLIVTITRDSGQMKMSKVEFVP
ncbi:VirB8/TrbF family protein [Mycobacterium aquaticum]|uniref:VirB8/TrbF family protein n=1 Tax=Mycobacterium aquaticum TaxID=1927124 RepID=UPI0011510415|nr:VirB8/TrbF family protein [Mycobacterium aquaticum]